jgi:hypothetical protein
VTILSDTVAPSEGEVILSAGGVVSRGFVVVVVAFVVEEEDDEDVAPGASDVVVASSSVVVVSSSCAVDETKAFTFGVVSVTRRARIAEATRAETCVSSSAVGIAAA